MLLPPGIYINVIVQTLLQKVLTHNNNNNNFIYYLSNLCPDCQFLTSSWIEKVLILGASKPKKVLLKMDGKLFIHVCSTL